MKPYLILRTLIPFSFSSLIVLTSCEKDVPAGTTINVDKGNNDKIEVFKYYFTKNDYVYVARFKDCPNVQMTTYDETLGKSTIKTGGVIVCNKDTIHFVSTE